MTEFDQITRAARFGMSRVDTVMRHQETARHFRLRQPALAVLAAMFLVGFSLGNRTWPRDFSVSMAMLLIIAGATEARRYRACGRIHQCKRSLEVIGI